MVCQYYLRHNLMDSMQDTNSRELLRTHTILVISGYCEDLHGVLVPHLHIYLDNGTILDTHE